MSNTSRISGFKPVMHENGSPYNGQGRLFNVPATDGSAIYVGDPVKIVGNADANGIPQVTLAAAGAAILGVCIGVVAVKTDPVAGTLQTGSLALDTPQYRAASTNQYIMVETSPDVIYEVEQTTGGASVNYAAADVGLNADAFYGTGSTTTGNSACSLDMATKATTATLQFKLVGPVIRADNDITGVGATKVWVKINNAQFSAGTGTAGIA